MWTDNAWRTGKRILVLCSFTIIYAFSSVVIDNWLVSRLWVLLAVCTTKSYDRVVHIYLAAVEYCFKIQIPI